MHHAPPRRSSSPATVSRRTLTTAGLLAPIGLAAACGNSGADSIADKAKNDKKLVVGIKIDQPGWGLKKPDGTYGGFDVDVARYVAKELGVPESGITFKEAQSANREPFIQQGQVDMVVATYTINDTRKERISFAGPYYLAGQQIMVASDNDDITGPESLKENPDATVCSVTGSTPAENILEYLASPDQLTLFDEYSQCADSLENGQVDAVTTDNVILLGFVAESEDKFKLVGEQFLHWFLQEQREEVASMSHLLATMERAGDNLLLVEETLARTGDHESPLEAGAPPAAGGAL